MMKVMFFSASDPSRRLVEGDARQPRPGPGELLIRVHAAGVTRTELRWYPALHTEAGGKRSHAIPCHEFSGVIAGIGPEFSAFAVGEEVFGMNDWFAEGALAEYCTTLSSSVARKPLGLTHVEAASVPIGALTAWQGLFSRANLQPGERVLVHGGAGAVGVFAVQLARFAGARVIATASPDNSGFVHSLGAEEAIDSRAARWEERLSGFDVIFDTVGGETLERSWPLLTRGGRMITIVSEAKEMTDARIKRAFFIVEPNQGQLIEAAKMIEARQLRPVVDAVIPFSEAASAFGEEIPNRSRRGKLVVRLDVDVSR